MPQAFVLFLALAYMTTCFAQALPKGWRLATSEELADVERDGSPSRFSRAAADVNGDGIVDEAFVLKSTTFNGEALWVHLSTGPSAFRWVKLDQTKWNVDYHVDLGMGVAVANPGVHSYACFDEAKECNFGDHEGRPKLRLRDAALVYFKPGSAASMYFWSKKYGRFMRVWLSD